MHFSLPSAISILAIMATSSQAFVMDTYASGDCTGPVLENVNVWDNTCADWPKRFRSFTLRAYGSYHQKARFHEGDHGCNDNFLVERIWVDGGGKKIGECVPIIGGLEEAGSASSLFG